MDSLTRQPPKILFVHSGHSADSHLKHLTEAGLDVRETHRDTAVSTAIGFQPDIIVLDFSCDGDTVAALQAVTTTKDIPVIALATLADPDFLRH